MPMTSSFWKVLSIFEAIIILSGMALVFVYSDYKAGALPYDVRGVLSLIGSVAMLGLLFGGFIGWVMILSIILDKRKKGA